jgi:hypothetical protein
VYLNLFCLIEIDRSSISPLTESAPPPRVDTKDTAISDSGVTTLDRVTISDMKKGIIYIKWGRERAHARCRVETPVAGRSAYR